MYYSKYRKELEKIILQGNPTLVFDEELEKFHYFMRDNLHTDTIKLYRYSCTDFYNIRNFERQILRLSPNGSMNDVYEGMSAADINKLNAKDLESLSDLVYLKSFSETKDNLLMWSHYADNNRGICVEYSLDELKQENEVLEHIYPALYTDTRYLTTNLQEVIDQRRELKICFENNYVIDDITYLVDIIPQFLVKGKCWEYENEWRLIYSAYEIYDKNEELLNNYIVEFDCATAIYFGYRIDKEVKDNLIEIIQRINMRRKKQNRTCIRAYQVYLVDHKYKFGYQEITVD